MSMSKPKPAEATTTSKAKNKGVQITELPSGLRYTYDVRDKPFFDALWIRAHSAQTHISEDVLGKGENIDRDKLSAPGIIQRGMVSPGSVLSLPYIIEQCMDVYHPGVNANTQDPNGPRVVPVVNKATREEYEELSEAKKKLVQKQHGLIMKSGIIDKATIGVKTQYHQQRTEELQYRRDLKNRGKKHADDMRQRRTDAKKNKTDPELPVITTKPKTMTRTKRGRARDDDSSMDM